MGLFDYKTYIIDEKLLAIQHTLMIKDEKGKELGKAVKKILSVTEEIEFTDNTGQHVGIVKRKLLAPITNYEVENQYHQHIADIKKKVLAIGDDWWVEEPGGKKVLNIDGNILGLEYNIKDTMGSKVAQVSKKFFSIRDSYGVKITKDVDPFIVLAVVAAIDLEKIKKEKKL